MNTVLIDNSTLTAVQRLLGDIVIKNKSLIDGDILALENLLQCILLYDEIKFVDDYKEEFREDREKRFDFIRKVKINDPDYESIISSAKSYQKTIEINGGKFTGEFKEIMQNLKMHMAFTWDMQSSEYFLWGKMLKGQESSSQDEELFKCQLASLMNQNIKNNLLKQNVNLVSSEGKPIDRNPYLDKNNNTEGKIFSPQTQLLVNSLSWISFRTLFYLILAKKEEADLFLHPIRNAFHLNILLKNDEEVRTSNFMKNLLNKTVVKSYERITESINFTGESFTFPIFSSWIINKVSDPQKIILHALELKSRPEFLELRKELSDLRYENFSNPQSANKLILDIKKSLKKINEEYYIENYQGKLFSNLGLLINTLSCNFLPILEKAGDYLKNNLETKTGHLFRSVTKDLLSVSKMGESHDKLISDVDLHKDADEQYIKIEEEQFFRQSSHWKKPM